MMRNTVKNSLMMTVTKQNKNHHHNLKQSLPSQKLNQYTVRMNIKMMALRRETETWMKRLFLIWIDSDIIF